MRAVDEIADSYLLNDKRANISATTVVGIKLERPTTGGNRDSMHDFSVSGLHRESIRQHAGVRWQ